MRETSFPAPPASQPNPAAVCPSQLVRIEKAETNVPDSLTIHGIQMVKSLKRLRQLIRRDTSYTIPHLKVRTSTLQTLAS